MDNELKKMLDNSKIDKIYSNSLFSLKSISENLGIWEGLSNTEKFYLENITKRDSDLNKNFQFRGSYDMNLVYSEITRKGVETLSEKIEKYRKVTNKDVFVDIGGGSGKLSMHLGIISNLKTLVSVELVDIRNKYAKHTYEQVAPIDDKSIFFINKDIKDFDLSIATVVFMNDVCFSKELRDSIYEKIPRGCHFITSMERPECKILKEEILLNISWNKHKVKFYYYIK
jgi:predicted RNA methylase